MDDSAFKAQISCVGITEGLYWYFLHGILFDAEYGSQLFRSQLRPHDSPTVPIYDDIALKSQISCVGITERVQQYQKDLKTVDGTQYLAHFGALQKGEI